MALMLGYSAINTINKTTNAIRRTRQPVLELFFFLRFLDAMLKILVRRLARVKTRGLKDR